MIEDHLVKHHRVYGMSIHDDHGFAYAEERNWKYPSVFCVLRICICSFSFGNYIVFPSSMYCY